jgi:DNA excision repair protein ERCC-2
MPTGTGKTVCLIALITSYQFQYPQTGKLIYCTRTVPEMYKCMDEIKKVISYRTKLLGQRGGNMLALCLSSRRNMCVHPRVMEEGDREAVDSLCRNMTASWIRSKVYGTKKGEPIVPRPINIEDIGSVGNETQGEGYHLCDYYEKFALEGGESGKSHCLFAYVIDSL